MDGLEPKPAIFDLTPDRLEGLVVAWGMPAYRAKQVLKWVYRRGVADPDQMTDIAAGDRRTLAERLCFTEGRVVREQTASDAVWKLLVAWPRESGGLTVLGDDSSSSDPWQTECVMIPSNSRASGKARRTACVSSQVGCPVGCRFCASGLGGLDGNLTAGRIVEQVWRLGASGGADNGITHVVFMGMGEPLANFEQVVRAIGTITGEWGLGISARRVTVSTVGLPAQIRRLADLKLPITLAISLHAPNDTLRREIIPWAESVSVDQLVDAGRYYFDQTGREVTLEYTLLGGTNDSTDQARQLAVVAKRLRSSVNLIRYNEVDGLPYRRPADGDVHRFQAALRSAGVNTHIRASRGRDIAAACGQLRAAERAGNG